MNLRFMKGIWNLKFSKRCSYVFEKIMLRVDGMCESEIDILLCESSVALYVWNVFPMQFFLKMKIEMSMGTYAPMCLKVIMLNVDGCVNQRLNCWSANLVLPSMCEIYFLCSSFWGWKLKCRLLPMPLCV
jgi:hypothetical protein